MTNLNDDLFLLDQDEQFSHLQPLAEQGDADAQCYLGICYAEGIGIERDPAEAYYLFCQSAAQGNANGEYALGLWYYLGDGGESDYEQALHWIRKAAEQGLVVAQRRLCDIYLKGCIVERDYEQAFHWALLAAEQGDKVAQYTLSHCDLGGIVDSEQADHWSRKSIEWSDADCQFDFVQHYESRLVDKDNELRIRQHQQAAQQGDAEAQFNLGLSYELGDGVDQDDELCLYWYRQAAEQGHAGAQFILGTFYLNGIIVEEDAMQAVELFHLAAEQGEEGGMDMLGICYENGYGVGEDLERAVHWYRLSAEKGSANGQYLLGECYALGKGVEQDPEQAAYWYRKAAEQEHEDAQEALERIAMLPYLQNITQLDCREIIYQVEDGCWFLNLHSPYDGEIAPEWKERIVGVKEYEKDKLCPINDSCVGAIYVLERDGKKGLFAIHHYHGMGSGVFFSPDREPFIYSDVKVYSDWDEWDSYGYAACEQCDGWKLVKVTQFPESNYEVVGEGFSSAEEAMKSIGIDDCERYLTKEW